MKKQANKAAMFVMLIFFALIATIIIGTGVSSCVDAKQNQENPAVIENTISPNLT